MSEEGLISAYADYLRERDFSSAMTLCRTLRLTGHAVDAQGLCLEWIDKVSDPFECAQLGIDMNYLGMVTQSRELLGSVAASFPYGVNRYLAQSELSIALYLLGNYHEAHAIFQSLRDTAEAANLVELLYPRASESTRTFVRERYLGIADPVAGKHVVILREGGFGDLVMYSRYIDMLIAEGAGTVSIEAPPHLGDCIRTDERVKAVSDMHGALDMQDCVVTTMFSLLARYQSTPYFPRLRSRRIAEPSIHDLAPGLTAFLERTSGERRIGLIWRSASGARHEPYRSIDLQKLVPLLANQSYRFVSLQVDGLSEAEKALFAEYNIVDIGSQLRSFRETAAVMSRLDLLISVDTGPAHLASATGCPVWLLLAQACDSRWYDCQRFTPWYPSMQLYRQRKLGDWTLPLSELEESLAIELPAGRRGQTLPADG
jgi:hypothetical protein